MLAQQAGGDFFARVNLIFPFGNNLLSNNQYKNEYPLIHLG
jgi:hypothetical protein